MGNFIEKALPVAIESGCLGDDKLLAGFVDVAGVLASVRALESAFPSHFEHTFAAKANAMTSALSLVRSAGMGCEAASPGELAQAIKAGFNAADIVYDEPAKTTAVLKKALGLGVSLNIDSFQELARISDLMALSPSNAEIGIRINPQVGSGSIGPMSTATISSKFGVPLEDGQNRELIIKAFQEHDWLSALHSHVGSQGCELELMIGGIRRVVDLALEINASGGRSKVSCIDIGGGLPVNFDSDEITPTFSDYALQLREAVPELFTGEFRVKTEFGRSLMAKNGFMVTRVEYTKVAGGQHIAITHAGAQVAARTVFMPDYWPIRLSVFKPDGSPKSAPIVSQNVAGPLCFAGDMLGTARELPLIEPGDLVVMHDTGAYYFSMPFYYNALPAPAVYGIELPESSAPVVNVWREQQSEQEMQAVIG